jgi:hypothetical protein
LPSIALFYWTQLIEIRTNLSFLILCAVLFFFLHLPGNSSSIW